MWDLIVSVPDHCLSFYFSNNNNKVKDLLQQFNLIQLITDVTHFTEASASLIDLMIVRNMNNILARGVADPFVPDLIRYHCPVFILLKFIRPKFKTYKRKLVLQNIDNS